MAVTRFGVSLDEDLLEALDRFVTDNNFPNRSQAIRFLVEKNLVEKKWQCNNIVAGAVVLVYDRQKREIETRLAEIQHQYHEVVLSVQQFYISENNCLQIVSAKGPATRLTELSNKLISLKGITHGKLVMSRAD